MIQGNSFLRDGDPYGGPIIGGHRTGLSGTFGWAFGRDALGSLFAGFIIGFLKAAKEFTKKEDLEEILTRKYSFAIIWLILIFGLTCVHEML